jgi:hypothetical protein
MKLRVQKSGSAFRRLIGSRGWQCALALSGLAGLAALAGPQAQAAVNVDAGVDATASDRPGASAGADADAGVETRRAQLQARVQAVRASAPAQPDPAATGARTLREWTLAQWSNFSNWNNWANR